MKRVKLQKFGNYHAHNDGKRKPGLYNTTEAALLACEMSDKRIIELMNKYSVTVLSMDMLEDNVQEDTKDKE